MNPKPPNPKRRKHPIVVPIDLPPDTLINAMANYGTVQVPPRAEPYVREFLEWLGLPELSPGEVSREFTLTRTQQERLFCVVAYTINALSFDVATLPIMEMVVKTCREWHDNSVKM